MQLTMDHYKAALVHERGVEGEGPATAEGLGYTETEAELSTRRLPW
jgi:hypothetical protein